MVGRAVGRSLYGHVITKFSRMCRLLHFLTHGAPLACFAHESPAIIGQSGAKYSDLSVKLFSFSLLYKLFFLFFFFLFSNVFPFGSFPFTLYSLAGSLR